MRKFVCAAIVTLLTVSFALAEEYLAIVTKIDDGKVTFKKMPTEKGGKIGDETTLPLTKSAKMVKGKFAKGDDGKPKVEAGDALDKDAVKTMMEKAAETKFKGVFTQIVTNADGTKITEIRFVQFGKKKKKDDK